VTDRQQTGLQHFVPVFYLKRFAGPSRELQILDGHLRKLIKPRGPKGICVEPYFYAMDTGKQDQTSQDVEKEFTRLENAISVEVALAIDALMTGRQISDKSKWFVAQLMAMIWARGPAMREQINRSADQMIKKLMNFSAEVGSIDATIDALDKKGGTTSSPEERERMRRMFETGGYELGFSNWHHLSFLENMTEFANLLAGQWWNVYINQTGESFVTTDNPVAVVSPPRQGFFGPSFFEQTHYFALTPEICIEALYTEHDKGKSLRRKTLFPGQEEEVVKLNIPIAAQSTRYAYARDRRPLETLRVLIEHARARRAGLAGPPAPPTAPPA
jgi:hypothetical protein